jgi:hypothetical protein
MTIPRSFLTAPKFGYSFLSNQTYSTRIWYEFNALPARRQVFLSFSKNLENASALAQASWLVPT